ncbi:UTRA domain-containing protein [Streptomyces niveus]
MASILGVPKRAKVLVQRLLIEDEGEAVELFSSYFPAGLVDGTDLGDLAPLDGSLRAHLEARKKVRFDHVTERVSARLPSAEEAEHLGMSTADPVLSVLVVACDGQGRLCRSRMWCCPVTGKSWKTRIDRADAAS